MEMQIPQIPAVPRLLEVLPPLVARLRSMSPFAA